MATLSDKQQAFLQDKIKYTGAGLSDFEGRIIVRVKPERVLTYNLD